MAAKAHISGYQDDICTWSESGLHAWQIQVCEVPLATNNTKKERPRRGGPSSSNCRVAYAASWFCFRRRHASNAPAAVIKPGRPAPTIGPGTGAAATPMTEFGARL
jgi:hypothetical protein